MKQSQRYFLEQSLSKAAMGGSTDNPTSSDQSQFSHRGRAIKSCLECRRRKMRCSRSQPCQNCSRFSRTCVYLPYPDWPSISSPEVQTSSAQRVSGLREDLTHAPTNPIPRIRSDQRAPLTHAPTNPIPRIRSDQRVPLTPTVSDIETDRHAKHDGFYDVDADDDTLDLGLQIGRLRVTERVGGFFRPQIASEVSLIICHLFPWPNDPFQSPPSTDKVLRRLQASCLRITSRICRTTLSQLLESLIISSPTTFS